MNDKIKELATQIEHWEIYDNGGKPIVYDNEPYGAASHMEFSSIQKFAELLVRECIEVVEAGKVGLTQVPSEVALDLTAKNIKAYFGIKDAKMRDMKPLSDYGHHMTIDDFFDEVKYGALIPEDGDGYWATETQESRINVWDEDNPRWATHVMWYNK